MQDRLPTGGNVKDTPVYMPHQFNGENKYQKVEVELQLRYLFYEVIKMSSSSENVMSYQKRRKKDLVRLFGGKCLICGFDKFQEALEFHHVNPQEKDFGLATGIKSLEKQLEEAKKCIMVCSNCHRGIHAGHYEVPNNWKDQYNEIIAKELISQKYEKQENFCPNCGKPISRGAVHCSQCAALFQRKTERPDRETLKQLIRTKPFTQIAKQFNITDNGIRKWCDRYNLPRKKSDIIAYSDKEWANI